jgi:homoserine dehydrogenase
MPAADVARTAGLTEPRRLVLAGAGKVGTCLLELLAATADRLERERGVRFRLVAVAELGGAAIDPGGLEPRALVDATRDGRPIWTLPGQGKPEIDALEVLRTVDADVLVGATPTSLTHDSVGLDLTRAALRQGWDVVLADKGPLAKAYYELAELASVGPGARITRDRPTIQFSAATAGALPMVAFGRGLVGCTITSVEGVLNGTSHLILGLMEDGVGYDAALAEAQRRGKAETDPTLDVEGWDAAAKLVIVANAVLDAHVGIEDVARQGITGVTASDLAEARRNGNRILPLARCRRNGSAWSLSVEPTEVPLDHALAKLDPTDLGIMFTSEELPRALAATTETGAETAATALLRDLVAVAEARAALGA